MTLGSGGGGGETVIKKSTYTYYVAASSTGHYISINEDSSKIIFVHFYDADATYTTANTVYEGFHLGPAAAYFSVVGTNNYWNFWRTNQAGSTTGFNAYGNGAPFGTDGKIYISTSPNLTAGHTITVEVYYED